MGSPPARTSVALPVAGQDPGAHTHPTLASICVSWVESVTHKHPVTILLGRGDALEGVQATSPRMADYIF